jgi:lipid II:glycine glycyltransferase (peptidoglycan interpeptide bridge formation enzyme)
LIEKCGQSEDLLKAFYDLLVPARKRHELPPQPYIWFKNIVDCLGEAVEIRLAYNKEGIPIAAIWTLRFRDKVYYKYGCSNMQFNNLGGMPFLLWRAIENGKTTGAKELDLGRSDDDNPGLITFKDKWTRNSCRLVYWRFPPPASRNSKVEWKFKLAKRMFGHMPTVLLSATGRLLYKHIG